MDLSATQRLLLFFLVCIPLRVGMAWYAWKLVQTPGRSMQQSAFTVLAAAMGVGFFVSQYLRETNQIQRTQLGGPVFWSSRLHGAVYLLFAALLAVNHPYAWVVLAADVAVGFAGAMYHHYGLGMAQFE